MRNKMSEHKFVLDSIGFPMIWVEAIDAYMQWLPVTKIQFEYFLCAVQDSHFDAKWYEEILYLNPRVSPQSIERGNYWNAFLTGILPDEVQRLARWYGRGYAIPTKDEWFTAYKYLKTFQPEPIEVITGIENLKERSTTLIRNLDYTSRDVLARIEYDRTLADQMLMRLGVIEWVERPSHQYRWVGMGETARRFHGDLRTPDSGEPSIPNNPTTDRLYYFGCRLIRRGR